MRSDELIAAARLSAFIGDANAFTEYTTAVMLRELNDKLQTVFEDIVVKARAGYWLHGVNLTTAANVARYRIPARAVVGGLEKVELAQTTLGPYVKLDEVPAAIAQNYETVAGGTTVVFTVSGDQVELLPAPNSAFALRLTYYIRPSRLAISQSSTQGGDGVDRGRITAINTVARTLVVNAVPFDQSLTVPAALTSGLQSIDVVHPDGWHELSLVGAPQTFATLTFTVGGTDSMADITIGDYVRVADQTDWPCLPDDFHRCLADACAIKILLEMNIGEKAAALAANNGNDLQRFQSLLQPRVKAEPKTIGIMRRARGWGYPYGWMR